MIEFCVTSGVHYFNGKTSPYWIGVITLSARTLDTGYLYGSTRADAVQQLRRLCAYHGIKAPDYIPTK